MAVTCSGSRAIVYSLDGEASSETHSGTTGAAVVRRLEIQFGGGGVDIDGTNSAGAGGGIAGRAQYSHCTISVMGYIALATQVVTGTAARGAVSVVEVMSVNGTILARSEVPVSQPTNVQSPHTDCHHPTHTTVISQTTGSHITLLATG